MTVQTKTVEIMRVSIPKDWRLIAVNEQIEHGDYYVYNNHWKAFDQLIGEKYKDNMPLGIRPMTRIAIIHLPLIVKSPEQTIDAKSRVKAYLKKIKNKA